MLKLFHIRKKTIAGAKPNVEHSSRQRYLQRFWSLDRVFSGMQDYCCLQAVKFNTNQNWVHIWEEKCPSKEGQHTDASGQKEVFCQNVAPKYYFLIREQIPESAHFKV